MIFYVSKKPAMSAYSNHKKAQRVGKENNGSAAPG